MTPEQIRALLLRNDHAVERAILAIAARQTSDELSQGMTRHHNGQGFSSFHAQRGTYYARWLQSGRRLTGHHLEAARKMALHYAGQLSQVAADRAASQANNLYHPLISQGVGQ